jgi:hypothetical protein
VEGFFEKGFPFQDFLFCFDVENAEILLYMINVTGDRYVVDAEHPGQQIEDDLAVFRGNLGKQTLSEPVVFKKDAFVLDKNSGQGHSDSCVLPASAKINCGFPDVVQRKIRTISARNNPCK